MKIAILSLFALALGAQELTITLKTAEGQEASQTIKGEPVAAGMEVLEQFRLTQCAEYSTMINAVSPPPAPPCIRYTYADIGEVLTAIIVGRIKELSLQFPTSATRSEREAKASADAALEAKRNSLFEAAKPEAKPK